MREQDGSWGAATAPHHRLGARLAVGRCGTGGLVIRRRVVVRGRVQGVFFRDTARREADARGVAGSVANLDDGSVELVLEGDPDAVAGVVEWAGTGPDDARVESVDVEEQEPRGAVGFEVR